MKRFYQKCLTTYITKNINTKERTFPFNIKTITGNNACKTVPGTSFPHFFLGGGCRPVPYIRSDGLPILPGSAAGAAALKLGGVLLFRMCFEKGVWLFVSCFGGCLIAAAPQRHHSSTTAAAAAAAAAPAAAAAAPAAGSSREQQAGSSKQQQAAFDPLGSRQQQGAAGSRQQAAAGSRQPQAAVSIL